MNAPGAEQRNHAPGSAVTLGIMAYDVVAPIQGVDEWMRQREAVLMAQQVDASRQFMAIPGVQGPNRGPNAC